MLNHKERLKKISGKFNSSQRYANFGPIVQRIEISGFRGVRELSLEIKSPITAISGLNGTGKSTIAQLFSCAYKQSNTTNNTRYYIKDFFPVSPADPSPFTAEARVGFVYSTEETEDPRRVQISRRSGGRWSDYRRQPERNCYYIGFTQFIPKVERRDFSVYSSQKLTIGETSNLPEGAQESIAKILSLPYESLSFTEVSHDSRSTELAMATRNGKSYSENHMGFGEGRVVYIVKAMESAPMQSLFVLEEPETSLHGDAQRRLAQYFVDVCHRRGHQILLTTHSGSMLGELARDSIVYLKRNPDGSLSATTGLSTYQVDSYLHGRKSSHGVTICIEDSFSQYLTTEILRARDPHLLTGCSFLAIGGGQEIPTAVSVLRNAGVKAAGISDGDIKIKRSDFVSEYPVGTAPEKFVFDNEAVKNHFRVKHSVETDEILASIDDHHAYSRAIADSIRIPRESVEHEACSAYIQDVGLSAFDNLYQFLDSKLFKAS